MNEPERKDMDIKVPNHFNRPASVSLLSEGPRSRHRGFLKALLIILFVGVLALGALLLSQATSLSSRIFVGQKTTFLQKIRDIIRGGNSPLVGEDSGQVNILLLGIGGEGHDGPYLTDTMMLAQLRFDTNEVVLTSIPRDYWVKMPNGGQAKINSAFAEGIGRNQDWNQAGQGAIKTVENLTGLNIPYFAVVDFAGFEKAVNTVGGVDVTVDRTFTDYSYPDSGTGYLPPITFAAGPQHMDGARALEFARSRHAPGIEGSDFARGQRQQKVIGALKAKILSLNLISNIGTVNQLLGIFADHFHTNLAPAEIYHLYGLVKERNIQSFFSTSLDPDTHLICPYIEPTDGAYVLIPCPGYSELDIQNFFKNAFSVGKLKQENATVWLANTTANKAAYQTAFRKLTAAGFNVLELSYSTDNLPSSLVYQVNPKPASAEYIKNTVPAAEVTVPPPAVKINKDKVDIIVILGQDAPVEKVPAYLPPGYGTAATASSTSAKTPTTAPQQSATTSSSSAESIPGLTF